MCLCVTLYIFLPVSVTRCRRKGGVTKKKSTTEMGVEVGKPSQRTRVTELTGETKCRGNLGTTVVV